MMKELGHKVKLGQKITDKMKEDFGAYMAKILIEVIEGGPTSPMAKSLMVTPPFANYQGFKQVDHLVFSGGVSEHVYDHDRTAYGDIGPVLEKTCAPIWTSSRKEFCANPSKAFERPSSAPANIRFRQAGIRAMFPTCTRCRFTASK